jgi:hypothetical protein
MPPAARRRVTQAARRFSADDLAALGRAERRKLMQLLLTESGGRVVEYHSPAAYDELVLESRPLWRPRRVRVRVATRPVEQPAVQRLADAVAAAGDAEGLLLAPLGVADGQQAPPTVMIVGPEELIARMERCAVIAWPDGRPAPAYARLSLQRDLDRDAFLLDPVGLRWLPSLSLNELPPELSGREIAPDALFERLAFRLFTSALRFGGTRYGESARGQRLPDAVLSLPGGVRLLALVDCKASADGYTMESDHYLRFTGYIDSLRGELEGDGDALRYLIVLSSGFPASRSRRHPYHGRAAALLKDRNVRLVYLRAQDIARTATLVESRALAPAAREGLAWAEVFDHGLVEPAHLDRMVAD